MSSQSAFLATATARFSIRPTRFAYLVRPGKLVDLVWAISHASTEWGGYSNPILPLGRRGVPGLYRQIAEMVRPDYLAYAPGVSPQEVLGVANEMKLTPVSAGAADQWGLHTLAAVPAEGLQARTVFVPKAARNPMHLAALGTIPEAHLEAWATAGAQVARVNNAADIVDAQLTVPSPISSTRSQAGAFQTSAFGGPIIVSTYPASVRRATYFWNLRATEIGGSFDWGPRLIWMPDSGLEDPEVWNRLRAACLSSSTDPDLVLLGPDPDRLRGAALSGGFIERAEPGTKSRIRFGQEVRDLDARPLQFAVNVHPATWLFGDRLYGRQTAVQVTVSRPQTTLRTESPVGWRERFGGMVWASIDGIEELRWPKLPAVARLLHSNATARPEGVTFHVNTARTFEFKLSVPSPADVASAILGAEGWTYRLSDKGRYASALVQASGTDRTVLSSPLAGDISALLSSLSRRKAEQMLARLGLSHSADELVEVVAEAMAARSQRWRSVGEIASELRVAQATLLPTLEELIKARLVYRGFALTCETCGMTSHVTLDQAADELDCPGCRSRQVLSGPAGKEPAIVYALNSLLDRAIDQNCLEHVVLMDWAERKLAAVWALPGALVDSREGEGREVDLLALSRDSLVVGEVKATHKALSPDAAKSTIDLARRLGAGVAILAAMDEWPDDERSDFSEVVRRESGLRVEVLGRGQLTAA